MRPTTELQKNYRTSLMETIVTKNRTKTITLQKITDQVIFSWWIFYLSSLFAITLGIAIMK